MKRHKNLSSGEIRKLERDFSSHPIITRLVQEVKEQRTLMPRGGRGRGAAARNGGGRTGATHTQTEARI